MTGKLNRMWWAGRARHRVHASDVTDGHVRVVTDGHACDVAGVHSSDVTAAPQASIVCEVQRQRT